MAPLEWDYGAARAVVEAVKNRDLDPLRRPESRKCGRGGGCAEEPDGKQPATADKTVNVRRANCNVRTRVQPGEQRICQNRQNSLKGLVWRAVVVKTVCGTCGSGGHCFFPDLVHAGS